MIKVETPTEPAAKPFPKLMTPKKGEENKGTIILFEKYGCGTVIQGKEYYKEKEGYYSNNWAMWPFTDYNEPITIQNA